MSSYSRTNSGTETETFSIRDARYLASRIKIGLTYIRLFYGNITEEYVENLTLEAAILLKAGLLSKVIYGCKVDGEIRYALTFTVNNLGQLQASNDEPTQLSIPPFLENPRFFSFLVTRHNPDLTQADHDAIEKLLPIHRGDGVEPSMINGTTSSNDSYYRNGYGMTRSVYTSI